MQQIIIKTLLFNFNTRFTLLVLFTLAFFLLSIGSAEHTSVTGKDEYFLALRTPLCMREQQVWLIPCLDGEPRLRKPPLLYWLTRASLEIFGPSLNSARLIAISFAAILILTIAMLSLELGYTINTALIAGFIALSYLSIAIGGRILEHDIPTATWSSLAFLWLLRWYHSKQTQYIILIAIFLTAGFLTKGPIVFIVCGAGMISLLINDLQARSWLRQHWIDIFNIVFITTILTAPWFIYVYLQYPTIGVKLLINEIQDREFPHLSLLPVYGLLLLALPWSFISLNIIFNYIINRELKTNTPSQCYNHTTTSSMLILWLGLTLLPFFFIRSFERYLFGSLVPLTLLLSTVTTIGNHREKIAARIGLFITLPAALLIQIIAIIINGTANWLLLTFPATIWFSYQWWQAYRIKYMALSAALLWTCIIGLVYPRLGINKIPLELLKTVHNQEIVFFNGPQPALLPALLGRSLVHVDATWRLPQYLQQPCAEFWLLSEEFEINNVLVGIKTLKLTAIEKGRFGILSSHVTWANMLRSGITITQLFDAVTNRKLSEIMPQVLLHRIRNPQCSKTSNT